MATAKQTLAVRKDDDFYAWLLDQARTLRQLAGQVPSLDCADIAEELEGMARSDEHALESFLERLLKHLLKSRYESHRQSPSWRVSIQNARSDIRDRLADSPSLQAKLPTLIARAYEKSRRSAGAEMEVEEREWDEKSPSSCPWSVAQILSDFWPDPVNGLEH
jgi:Domain of unknown function DUF29